MITVSAALQAHLQQPYQSTTTCWLVVLSNGTVLGFTSFDQPLTFNLEAAMGTLGLSIPPGILATGSVNYAAATGYTPSDVAGNADLSPDNLEISGILSSPSITEADLNAGLWDFARVTIFMVNWADLSQGAMVMRSGTLGQVTVERNTFKAEVRGVAQAYSRTVGELTSPMCRARFGDTRCKFNVASVTVASALTGVNADNMTLYDTARAEPGPTAPVAITGITRANPGVVTVASNLGLANGTVISIYGVLGMVQVNTDTVLLNPNAAGTTFELPVDTTSFPIRTGGGNVIALGGGTAYFDYGVITFTSGLNNGLSMEVKNYVPGQITLQLPMPYLCAIGDTYTMSAGCGHSLIDDCKTRFNNVVNFRGEPYLPGLDRLVQVGKQQTAG